MNIGTLISQWYTNNARELPWRETKDPYFIWVSEIIMQQTRIEQGMPYYLKFIKKFPSVKHLALANEDEVLLLWQGLGYYSRAKNMHTTAKFVYYELKGRFPSNAKELLKLKGVGKYTAAAISSFCYNENIAAIDGNVIRVIARLYNIQEPVNKTPTIKQIEKISTNIVKTVQANNYNQAMMDLGATICTPRNPKCELCPINNNCLAFTQQTIHHVPFKEKNTKTNNRYFIYMVFKTNNATLIRKRTENDIWNSLYEFVLIETENMISDKQILQNKEVKQYLKSVPEASIKITKVKSHKLSHQTIHAHFIEVLCNTIPKIKNYNITDISEINNYAFPQLIQNYIPQLIST